MSEGTWYTDAVQWSVDNGIANIAGFCFGPETPVSRGETAVWIYNMEDRPDAGDPHSFTDVTNAYQDDAISWMANTGITTGTSPTTFAPDETLRRAQVAAFLYRLADKPSAPPHSFSDVVAGWQQDPVSWMSKTGITTGTSPTTFAPEETLTRAQLITFLYRYKGKPDVTIDTSTPDCDPTAEVTEDPMADDPAQTEGGDMEQMSLTPGEGIAITMARADWSTGYFQAQVYKQLLEELGYEVTKPSELELNPSLAYLGMSQGEFDFWVNSWYPGHIGWWAPELPDGSQVGDHLTIVGNQMVPGSVQGFLITKSFADEHGVTHLDQLNDDPDILAAFDAGDRSPGNGVADIYGCTESWTCDDIIDNQIAFSDWTNIAQVKANYDAMFFEATAKANAGEPMVIYTWSPSAYITQLRPGDNVVWLAVEDVLDDSNPTGIEGGEGHDQRPGQANLGPEVCPAAASADNCQLGWVAANIQVTANTEWLNANPYAAELFCQVTLSVIDVSQANVDQSNAGFGATEDFIAGQAADWIADNRDQVDGWLEAARMPPMEPTCPDTVIPQVRWDRTIRVG